MERRVYVTLYITIFIATCLLIYKFFFPAKLACSDSSFYLSQTQIKTGDPVTVKDSIDEVTTREWDFGDGSAKEMDESLVKHSYTKKGPYTITLKRNNNCEKTATVIVLEEEDFGDAKITAKSEADVGEKIKFEVSKSGLHIYEWSFGESGIVDTIIENENTVSHTYKTPNEYTVLVRLNKSKGQVSFPIKIKPKNPHGGITVTQEYVSQKLQGMFQNSTQDEIVSNIYYDLLKKLCNNPSVKFYFNPSLPAEQEKIAQSSFEELKDMLSMSNYSSYHVINVKFLSPVGECVTKIQVDLSK